MERCNSTHSEYSAPARTPCNARCPAHGASACSVGSQSAPCLDGETALTFECEHVIYPLIFHLNAN